MPPGLLEFRFAWREITHSKRFSFFFVFNLTLGLFGFLSLDSFKTSFENSLSAQSRSMLTADVAISSRRHLLPAEQAAVDDVMGAASEVSQVIELYSMAKLDKSIPGTPPVTRLVELVAVDEKYPFYGDIGLESGRRITSRSPKEILQGPEVWVSPELGAQMGIKKGDQLRIGNDDFKVSDFIRSDASTSWRGMALAPRIYIGHKSLASTSLIQVGSTVTYRSLFKLPPAIDSEQVIEKLNQLIDDPSVRIVNHRTAASQTSRTMDYLNDYLGLVSLVAFFLAAIGAGYLFRSYLALRLREIAIYMSLGMTHVSARRIYLFQLALLGGGAALSAAALSTALLPALTQWLNTLFQLPLQFRWDPRSLGLALIMGVSGSVMICRPLLVRIRDLQPSALFQEAAGASLEGPANSSWQVSKIFGFFLNWAPAAVAFWLLAVWQARSLKTGSLFVAGLGIAGLALAAVGLVGLRWMGRISRSRTLRTKMAFRSLSRHAVSSLSCFLAVGLGTLLINLIPQIQKNIDAEIQQPEVSEVPSLFLFDIQEDQLGALREFLESARTTLSGVSPLIRARLETVNGESFQKPAKGSGLSTREQEREERSRNRGYNLTYRMNLTEAETLSAGRPFSGTYQGEGPAEISVEKNFAERLDLELGDTLVFDVQGVPVAGRVVSFRRVKWTSFQPNFFIQFQPGALDGAPKTFLGSVPKLEIEKRAVIQNELVKEFPNISIVDITQVIQKLLDLFVQMGWAIRVMAYLSLFAGFVVLFSISNHQARSRKTETHLLKILGARFADVQAFYLLEFTLLGASAAALGAVLSMIMSYGIARFLFDGLWVFVWRIPVLTVFSVTGMSFLTSWIATRKVLSTPPREILQSELS